MPPASGSPPPDTSLRAAFAQAVQLFQAGRLPEAEAALRRLAAVAPSSPEVAELLGICLGAQHRHAEAFEWFERACGLRPPSASLLQNRAQALFALGKPAEARADLERAVALKPDAHTAWSTLGNVLAAQGEREAAERAYRRALALRPDHPESHYNLALLFQGAGRLDEAVAAYRKALSARPAFAAAHNNLANTLKLQGRLAEALGHYEQALRIEPGLADALSNYGTALREAGRPMEAIPLLEKAARLKPDSAAVLNNLGIAYFGINRFEEAEACYRRALARQPDFHEAENNLGNALTGQGRHREAIECFRAVIARAPDYADAHSNLGLTLQETGEIEAAIDAYREALRLKPDHADAINNIGYLLQEQGRRGEAMDYYRRALAVNPDSARAANNLGLAKLCEFDFAEGWRLCEQRYYTVPPVAVPRPFSIPRFTGEDWGRTRRLAVWKEQGVGDQLLYSTLLPEVASRGVPFVFEVDRRLVEAYRRAHADWAVVPPEHSEAAFADCDRHISVSSLGGLLRNQLSDFDRQPRALLAADAERSAAMRSRLAAPGTRVIGISWRSFQPAARGVLQRKKSAPLETFLDLSRRPGIQLLDLQYGDTAADRADFAARGGRLSRLEDLDLFNDLEGVLAAIEACDLVVTTSNVTAHFAGVIGKPAWLIFLGANPPFHYWSTDASGRCLWYPSVTIVTGPGLATWPAVMARVHERLDA